MFRRLNSAIDTLFVAAAAFSAGYVVHELINNEEEAKRAARRLLFRTRHAGEKVKDLVVAKVQSFKQKECFAKEDLDDLSDELDFDAEMPAEEEASVAEAPEA